MYSINPFPAEAVIIMTVSLLTFFKKLQSTLCWSYAHAVGTSTCALSCSFTWYV